MLHPWRATLAALAMGLLAMHITARAQTGDCPTSARVDLPACASGSHGHDSHDLFWYEVDNDCAEAITVKIDVIATWDDHIVVPARHRERRRHVQGKVRNIKCCTDDPDSNCYADAAPPPPSPSPTARDLRPRYYFQVGIGDALRAPGYQPAWTARLACHSLDLNLWIDETIDPWERVWCDARYGAHVWVTFKIAGGITTHEPIDPPLTNPCAAGGPAYEITQDRYEGVTISTALEHEQVGCR